MEDEKTDRASLLRDDPISEVKTETLPNKESFDWGDWVPCAHHPRADHELVCFECNPTLAADVSETGRVESETVARLFHQHYEQHAPHFGYSTRPETQVPWDRLPDANRRLMISTVECVLHDLRMPWITNTKVGEIQGVHQELLKALKEAVAVIEYEGFGTDNLRAVIAKAEAIGSGTPVVGEASGIYAQERSAQDVHASAGEDQEIARLKAAITKQREFFKAMMAENTTHHMKLFREQEARAARAAAREREVFEAGFYAGARVEFERQLTADDAYTAYLQQIGSGTESQ